MKYNIADYEDFWANSEESNRDWKKPMPSKQELSMIEERMGYILPASYIQFMAQTQNGGLLSKDTFPIFDENSVVIKCLKCTFLHAISAEDLFSVKEYSEKWNRTDYIGEGVRLGSDLNATRATYFILDYKNLNVCGEPKVSYIKGYWDSKTTSYTHTIVADSFEEFVSGLIKAPKPKPFAFDSFKKLLKPATLKAFKLALANYKDDEISAFGLYTNSDATMLAPAVNTTNWLEEKITKNPKESKFYTYETMEWKYEGYDTKNNFIALEKMLGSYVGLISSESKVSSFRDKILNILTEVLEELKAEGIFNITGNHDIILMINVSSDGLSAKKWKDTIKRLNSK